MLRALQSRACVLQVMAKQFEVIKLASQAPNFGRRDMLVAMNGLVEKVGIMQAACNPYMHGAPCRASSVLCCEERVQPPLSFVWNVLYGEGRGALTDSCPALVILWCRWQTLSWRSPSRRR